MVDENGKAATTAVFEYSGHHEPSEPHGNHRKPEDQGPYTRTPAETMAQISQQLKTKRPLQVYDSLKANGDTAPRDSNVVYNKQKADRWSKKKASGKTTCSNFGDEVQEVIKLVQTDNFVRCVIVTRNTVPSVILYTDRQIHELKSFCFRRTDGSVLGFDKTYNLAGLHVTPSVYKNSALIRRRTGDSPIFMGPIFIHSHSDIETYSQFFGHLSMKLMDCNQQQLTLGSDDELAVRKCFKHFFPRAATVVCSRHLKENVRSKLDELMGKSSVLRSQLFDAIFGSDGLIACDDLVSFDNAVDRLQSGVLTTGPPEFVEYFERRLRDLMRENVVAGPGRSFWTNNNCESMNHVLKVDVNWRPAQLPHLVDLLRSRVTSQYLEADRAMCQLGDFALRPAYSKYRMSADEWRGKSSEQQQKAARACFRLPGLATTTSRDGGLTIPTTPGGGKKPHQVKRPRNERTTSRKKLKL